MIRLNRMNGKEFILNCDLIEIIESTPNTVIKLNNGKKYIVKQSAQDVVDKIINFKRNISICNKVEEERCKNWI